MHKMQILQKGFSIGLSILLSASAAAEQLEEIVVTAQKRETSLQDTPIAITALQGSRLSQMGIERADDLGSFVPGADFSSNGGAVAITIRGVGSDGLAQPKDDPSVAAHIDGIYMSRPAALGAILFDVERVEVLRGPQGTLYGRNATGGSFNVVSKKPVYEFEGLLEGAVGNYGSRNVKGVVNVPLIENELALRVSGGINNHDGHSKELNPLFNDGDDLDETFFRGTLAWDASDTLKVSLSATLYDNEGVGPTRTNLDTTPLIGLVDANGDVYGGVTGDIIFDPAAAAAHLNEPRILSEERTSMNAYEPSMLVQTDTYSLEIEWAVSDNFTIKSLTGYTEFLQDFDRTAIQYEPDPLENATFDFVTDSTTKTQEINFNYDSGESLQLTSGLFYYKDEGINDFYEIPGDPAHSVNIHSLQEIETESYAAFAEGTYHLNEELALTLGLRYTEETKEGGSATDVSLGGPFGFVAPTNVLIGEYENDSTDYELGFQWTPNDDHMVFASVSTAFKSGGINTGAPINLYYEPEEITAFQVGWKSTWFSGLVSAQVDAYYYDYENLQITQVLGLSLETQNASNAEIKGLEIELQASPADGLQLRAFASFADSEYQNAVISDIIDLDQFGSNVFGEIDIDGNSLRFTPDFSFGANIAYTMDILGGDITSNLSFYWQDETFARPHALEVDKIDSYTKTNLSVRYTAQDDKYYIDVWGRNLEDETVVSARFVNPLHTVEWKAPRTYGLTLGYNF